MDEDIQRAVPKRKPAIARTPELQENEMIALAMRVAKKKMEDGTASSQMIVHFLQLGTEKAKLERAKLEAETKLAESKAEAMQMLQSSEEITIQALAAFRRYQGTNFVPEDEADQYVLYDE